MIEQKNHWNKLKRLSHKKLLEHIVLSPKQTNISRLPDNYANPCAFFCEFSLVIQSIVFESILNNKKSSTFEQHHPVQKNVRMMRNLQAWYHTLFLFLVGLRSLPQKSHRTGSYDTRHYSCAHFIGETLVIYYGKEMMALGLSWWGLRY
jgi:hypothetical protein